MIETLLIVIGVLAAAAVVLLIVLCARSTPTADFSPLLARLEALERSSERAERSLREDSARGREEAALAGRQLREEAAAQARQLREGTEAGLKSFNETVLAGMTSAAALQQQQVDGLTERLSKLLEANERRFDGLRTTVEQKLLQIQEANDRRLEEMRKTVDEKLQGTLDQRLGESFRLVTERLEAVHKGLGEMQALATGVGDLKRVLTNVKVRGTWAEYQLENLLEQILAPGQFERNVATRGGDERVEFAIRLPGRDENAAPVWLPLDSKFPKEDYERLIDAAERGDGAAADAAGRALEARLLESARVIREKYVQPPATTDFALLYLPLEGLYAEVLRRPGLVDRLQRECRVNVTGPTTLAALLNSLQMGFRTLAIEQRSSEVWSLLSAVKAEFAKFGEAVGRVQKKIQDAGSEFEKVAVRTRAIERRLREVEALPAGAEALSAPDLPALDPLEIEAAPQRG